MPYTMKELQDFYVDVLNEVGYKCESNSDGNVEIQDNDIKYVLAVFEDDPEYFCIYYMLKIRYDENDILKILNAINGTNKEVKLVRLAFNKEDGFIMFNGAYFIKDPNEFPIFFKRTLLQINHAVEYFINEMEDKK